MLSFKDQIIRDLSLLPNTLANADVTTLNAMQKARVRNHLMEASRHLRAISDFMELQSDEGDHDPVVKVLHTLSYLISGEIFDIFYADFMAALDSGASPSSLMEADLRAKAARKTAAVAAKKSTGKKKS